MLAVVSAIALAVLQGASIQRLFEVKAVREGPLGELAVILAPLFGLALAIERIVETAFDMFDQATEEVAKLWSAGTEGLGWIQEELH